MLGGNEFRLRRGFGPAAQNTRDAALAAQRLTPPEDIQMDAPLFEFRKNLKCSAEMNSSEHIKIPQNPKKRDTTFVVSLFFWSGRWESNPPLKLGKLSFYR